MTAESSSPTGHEFSEEAVFFGHGNALFGILNTSSGEPAPTGVILSLTPDMSESPVSARLARSLAGRGFVTLRFDQTGHGESGEGRNQTGRNGADDFLDAARFLEARSVNSVILIGAVSGARAALAAAVGLPYVEGLACAVLPVVDTARKVAESVGLREYLRRALGPDAIRKLADPERRRRYFGLARAKVRSLTRRPPRPSNRETVADPDPSADHNPDWRSTADPRVLDHLSSVIDRGVPTLLVNGSNDPQDRHLRRLFRGSQASPPAAGGNQPDLVTVDHIALKGFRSVAAQDQFIDVILEWIGSDRRD